MNKVNLLEALRTYTIKHTEDLVMPTRLQKGESEARERPAEVHLMRLPDSTAAHKKAPYILHQLINGADVHPAGDRARSSAIVRTICCVYNDNEEEGGLMLLNLMERLRINFLKDIIIADQFELDLSPPGLEFLVYPDDTAPYYVGEMMGTWKLPAVEREVLATWL